MGPNPPPGTNEFSLGKVKKNKKKGTAKLTVGVPGAGKLLIENKGINTDDCVLAAGKEKLPVPVTFGQKKKLKKKGKVKVTFEITFTPQGGTPNTQLKKIKLVKR